MAKHLKINIKNAQLAEVLQKNKQEKAKKDVKEEKPEQTPAKTPEALPQDEKKVVRARKAQSIAPPSKPAAEEKPAEKPVEKVEKPPVEAEPVKPVEVETPPPAAPVTPTITEKPEGKAPEAKAPESRPLEPKKPEWKPAESRRPEGRTSEGRPYRPPEHRRPEGRAPDSRPSESRRPDWKTSETRRPDSRAPDARRTDTRAPDARRPDGRAPDTRRPDSRPDFRRPTPRVEAPRVGPVPRIEPPHKETEEERAARKSKKAEKTREEPSKTEDKKKGLPSYKRQAFSRVFDTRGAGGLGAEEETWRRRRFQKSKQQKETGPIIRPKEISVLLPITIKELAAEMKVKASEVIQKFFMQGLTLTLNDLLDDPTTVELIGDEFDCKIHINTQQEERLQVTSDSIQQEINETDASLLEKRPPVVTVMGHVDHGKTSIIDAFRKSNLAAGEAGAITQHIGAFKCDTKHGSFTVLDTPGHEAFTEIRARGARVTDIVVLVIAGDEGIKPQTEEAIAKAQEANVPIIVAINKMDKPGFNPDEIYRQLADRNLLPEAWGGQVITVNCSAKTKEGIDQLGEMIALQSDVLELKAVPSARARGIVLESELHRGLGATATLLVQNGTLKEGDALIFEHVYGRVKTMHDEHNVRLTEAPPSSAVVVTGLSGVPGAGNAFIVLESEKEARKIAEDRKSQLKRTQLRHTRGKDIEQLFSKKAELHKKKILNIVLKADVGSSVQAVMSTLKAIPTDKVEINFVSADVGQISESDIELAETTNAIIVGFHTNLESYAEKLIRQKKIKMIIRDVIYHLVDEVKEHMITLLDKIRQENEVGEAKVLALFKSSKHGTIAGCRVTDGIIKRNHHVKILRDGEEIWKGSIASLKRNQDDAREVKKDLECGMNFDGFNDVQVDDIIKSYEVTYITQDL